MPTNKELLARIEELELKVEALEQGRGIPGESDDGKARRIAASKRGSAKVSDRYADLLTRTKYAEAVGVSPFTVSKWVKAGVLQPEIRRDVNGSVPVGVYTEADVALGKALREVQLESPGRHTVSEAADLARQRIKLPTAKGKS